MGRGEREGCKKEGRVGRSGEICEKKIATLAIVLCPFSIFLHLK
jgi:hypothetical protein